MLDVCGVVFESNGIYPFSFFLYVLLLAGVAVVGVIAYNYYPSSTVRCFCYEDFSMECRDRQTDRQLDVDDLVNALYF